MFSGELSGHIEDTLEWEQRYPFVILVRFLIVVRRSHWDTMVATADASERCGRPSSGA